MTLFNRFYPSVFLLLMFMLTQCGDKTTDNTSICSIDILNLTLSSSTFSPGTNLAANLTFFSPSTIDSATIFNMTAFYLSTDPFFSADDLALVSFPNQQLTEMNQQVSIHFDIIEIPFFGVNIGTQYLLAYIQEQPCKPDFTLLEATRTVVVTIN